MDKTHENEMTHGQIFKTLIKDYLMPFAEIMIGINQWLNNNADVILLCIEALKGLDSIYTASQIMADKQIVFTGNLSFEFAESITSNNAENQVLQYYCSNNKENLNKVIARCKNNCALEKFSSFFDEIIGAYNSNFYQLSCVGLYSLIDGVLSDVTDMPSVLNFKKRITNITESINNNISISDIDKKILVVMFSIDTVRESMFSSVNFDDEEDDNVNRNRMEHGRTYRKYTEIDFIKVLLLLDALLFLNDINKESNVLGESYERI